MKWKNVYAMTYSAAQWDTWDNSFALYYARGEDIIEHTNMASVMCLHFCMQEEDILEHTKAKCHLYTLVNL